MFFASEQLVETQQMLESISQSFITHTNIITENWLVGIAILLIGISLSLVYFFFRRRQSGAYFVTHSSGFTRSLLQDTFDKGLLVDVQVETLESLHVLQMQVIHISDKVFMLRSVQEKSIDNVGELEHKKIHCSLVNTHKKDQGYYMFATDIVHANSVESRLELTLTLPQHTEKVQRREHLRIEPKDEYILGIALWSEKIVNGSFINTPELWGDPEYRYVPGKINQVRLVNISASGAKMILSVDVASPKLTLDKRCIMLIDIWEPELEQKVRYWIRCAEQNISKIKDKHAIEIGVRFKEWTTMPLHDNSLHFVLTSKYGEIPPLANWIMKRYLEQYSELAETQTALSI